MRGFRTGLNKLGSFAWAYDGEMPSCQVGSPLPVALSLESITRNGSTLVAGGLRGAIVSSNDIGNTWAERIRIPVNDSSLINLRNMP